MPASGSEPFSADPGGRKPAGAVPAICGMVPPVDDADGYFGERVAATYDDSSYMFQPGAVEPAVGLLAELAGDGRALELAVGTGRIALPLAARGVPVHGIDLSRAMVARMRAKPGGDAIDVTIGDFATTRVAGTFRLAYLVFNEDGRGEYHTIPFRYVWPSELDLMARLAGMRLRDRWAGWTREPFTGDSPGHVSVWEKPVGP